MGMQMVFLKFPAAPPALLNIVETAERMGELPIKVIRSDPYSLVVAFEAFPEGQVTISTKESFEIGLVDYSLKAPTLFQLLIEAMKQFGAEVQEYGLAPLKLPLTEKVVRHDLLKVHVYSSIGVVLLFVMLATIVAFVLWAMGHSVVTWMKSATPQ